MAELLLELLSEEIPARMQARAAEDLKRLICDNLGVERLTFTKAESYVTPRRLTLVVDGLPLRQADVAEERRGPRVDAPAQAIEGFLRSAGLTLAQCEKRATDKGTFWFAVIAKKGAKTADMLPDLLGSVVTGFPWPKSMRWDGPTRWIRPVRGIVCLLDGKEIQFLFGGMKAGSATRGHRFLAPKPFTVRNFADYKKKLLKARVMLDPAERRAVIERDAAKLAAAKGLSLVPDVGLTNEVVGLVEWPVVLIGRIDEAFMDLPPEVLATVMRHHQKYFALKDKSGKLAPYFVAVANIETKDRGAAIVAGNERVLRARLADARFFLDQDRKKKLADRVPALKDRVFHAKLGNDFVRIQRLRLLAPMIAGFVPGTDKAAVDRAAELCKADLTTGMVGEFPELQGAVGRYYALADGENRAVADAIAEHYRPLGPGDFCPKAPVSVAVALADKLDTLVGFFAIGERPTGSKDPFALRRAALGVIRLTVENGLRIPLAEVFRHADALHAASARGPGARLDVNEMLAFFADRLKVALKEKGVRHDLIDAVLAVKKADGSLEDDLVRLLARVDALRAFLATGDGANLLVAYRRAANILKIEEKKDGRAYDAPADPALLTSPEEKALAAALDDARAKIAAALAAEKFQDAMRALSALRAPVDTFFDKVTVNCDDANLRVNRLRLLSRIRVALGGVADFSRIDG
ncbi:MAG: glycine--tRNA ligase subunit beta [Rhodospirillales bacterium]|nr:glycine--tRNA ligase subunit beta [Rhodospirillales bacterium]MSP80296.1 glycine--tRNA ligase subunit beta [Rhodospirillales bacterium]